MLDMQRKSNALLITHLSHRSSPVYEYAVHPEEEAVVPNILRNLPLRDSNEEEFNLRVDPDTEPW